MKCKQCNGDGWYADHSESHYRNGNNPDDCYKYGCPIQVQCADCLGTGEIKEETTDENKQNNNTPRETPAYTERQAVPYQHSPGRSDLVSQSLSGTGAEASPGDGTPGNVRQPEDAAEGE